MRTVAVDYQLISNDNSLLCSNPSNLLLFKVEDTATFNDICDSIKAQVELPNGYKFCDFAGLERVNDNGSRCDLAVGEQILETSSGNATINVKVRCIYQNIQVLPSNLSKCVAIGAIIGGIFGFLTETAVQYLRSLEGKQPSYPHILISTTNFAFMGAAVAAMSREPCNRNQQTINQL